MSPHMQQIKNKQLLQTTDTVFMVRPTAFGYNPQAAESNAFMQNDSGASSSSIATQAQSEFDEMVTIMRTQGIQVHVFEDNPKTHTPDSVFPNNWISFHNNGRIILYPMETENRRPERRMDIIEELVGDKAKVNIVDLSPFEEEGSYLEGTGSMILDRVNQIAYACVSPRTNPQLFARFCMELDVEGHLFHAVGSEGTPVYHTNVMMALGTTVAIVCLDSIQDPAEQQALITQLLEVDYEIVDITLEQMNAFAGNMLEVRNTEGKAFMIMSKRAYDSLRPEQIAAINVHASPLIVPLDVIETYGGGSVRCMIAEVYI